MEIIEVLQNRFNIFEIHGLGQFCWTVVFDAWSGAAKVVRNMPRCTIFSFTASALRCMCGTAMPAILAAMPKHATALAFTYGWPIYGTDHAVTPDFIVS